MNLKNLMIKTIMFWTHSDVPDYLVSSLYSLCISALKEAHFPQTFNS